MRVDDQIRPPLTRRTWVGVLRLASATLKRSAPDSVSAVSAVLHLETGLPEERTRLLEEAQRLGSAAGLTSSVRWHPSRLTVTVRFGRRPESMAPELRPRAGPARTRG